MYIGISSLFPIKRVHDIGVFLVVGLDPWIGRPPVVLDLWIWGIGWIQY